MTNSERKSIYKLDDSETKQFARLNERFIRWQEKSISLLSFSINILFTISMASIGLIMNNPDNTIFKNKFVYGCTLAHILLDVFILSAIAGLAALICRLFDFRLTKSTISKRILLFKVKNKIDLECNEKISEQEIERSIKNSRCWSDLLGKTTWDFFYLQTLFIIIGMLIIACKI